MNLQEQQAHTQLLVDNKQLNKELTRIKSKFKTLTCMMLYYRQYRNWGFESNHMFSFLRKSKSKNTAKRATEFFTSYWHIVNTKDSFFDGTHPDVIAHLERGRQIGIKNQNTNNN